MFLNKCFGVASLLICLQFFVNVHGRHFWVDYHGIVPDDAVIGGNVNNVTTYVGQALFLQDGTGLQPVVITNGSLSVLGYNEFTDKIQNVSTNIKILCSDTELKWEEFNFNNGNTYNKVSGGYEIFMNMTEMDLFIGRSVYNNQVVIGKAVIVDNLEFATFMFEYEETFIDITDSFEVLTF